MPPKRIAIIGANGQLGSDLVSEFGKRGHDIVPLNHERMDIGDAEAVRRVLSEIRPDIILNTAAMHNVEACEADPVAAFRVNALGVRHLALAAADLDAVLAHYSTDYVFDGAKQAPYAETDAPRPLNAYGNSKLAGEYFVRSLAPRHFVLRVGAIYGHAPCRAKGGRNFVTTMLALGRERPFLRVVDDEIVSPTPTAAIAGQSAALCQTEHYGLYHMAARGRCSWHAFAASIFDLAGIKTDLQVAAPGEFPAKVPRPAYSALENAGLARIGLDLMPDWRDGLKQFLDGRS